MKQDPRCLGSLKSSFLQMNFRVPDKKDNFFWSEKPVCQQKYKKYEAISYYVLNYNTILDKKTNPPIVSRVVCTLYIMLVMFLLTQGLLIQQQFCISKYIILERVIISWVSGWIHKALKSFRLEFEYYFICLFYFIMG